MAAMAVMEDGIDEQVHAGRWLTLGVLCLSLLAAAFTVAVEDGFVDALSNGLRISALVILGAAFVAWRFLPARARDPLAAHDGAVSPPFGDLAPSPVAGD